MLQIVRIVNKGDAPLILTNNADVYTVEVGGEKIVPYDCAASAFGDPRARDNGRDRGRTDVYEHVRAQWNYYLGFDDAITWDEKRPKFESYDVNTGERIWFVIDDPTGKHQFNMEAQAANATTTDAAILAASLAQLQAQVSQLTTALALTQAKDSGVGVPAPEVVPAAKTAADKVEEIPAGVDLTPAAAVSELPTAPAVEKPPVADGPKRATPSK